MKYTIIGWLIFSAALISSCNSTPTNYTSALYDVTDQHMPIVTFEELYAGLVTTEDIWSGLEFNYSVISDIEYNAEQVLSLPTEISWFGNEFKRKAKIKEFGKNLRSMVDSMKKDERKYSIIFPTVVRKVNELAKVTSMGKKSVLVFSDLMENAPELSFHRMNVQRLNTVQTGQLWKKLVKHYRIDLVENLAGIEVKFVYTAQNYEDSRKFGNLVNLYRQALEKRGATVVVSANLNGHG